MNVLIAEDDRGTRHLLKTNLSKWGYDTIECSHGDEAWELLQKTGHPRLVILDWMMPGKQGIDICKMIRENMKDQYVYIIMLTAKTDKDDIIAGLEAGADDYLTKPFDNHELQMRLYIGKRILALQNQLINVCNELRIKADHDGLTNLWNHRAILEILKREIQRANREKISVGVILADLDYFKKINDTYGHPVGDIVLAEIAKRLKNSVRAYDSVGRYGGEEFLLVLPGCAKGNLENMSKRLCAAISKEPVMVNDKSIVLTISIGAAASSFLGDNGELDTIIQAADEALYDAKSLGRNRVIMQN